MTDEAVAACPVCGAQASRLFFPAGIVFKGTGFYKTDSRAGVGDSTAGGDGTDKAKAAPAGETKEKPDTTAASAAKSAAKPSPDGPPTSTAAAGGSSSGSRSGESGPVPSGKD